MISSHTPLFLGRPVSRLASHFLSHSVSHLAGRIAGLSLTTLLIALNAFDASGATNAKSGHASTKPSAHSKATAKKAKFAQLQLLRPQEIARLSANDRLRYFKSLQKILLVLDSKHARTDKKPTKNAWTELLIPEAFAADKVENDPCLIGGYFGHWQSKGGSLSCSQPEAKQNWEDKEKDTFFCGKTDGGEQKAYCNSAFFLYASDKHDRICAPISNLTANCQAAFDERYSDDAGRLQKDAANLMLAMGKDEVNLYHSRAEKYLNYMIETEDADAASAQILTDQLAVLDSIRKLATKTYNHLAKEPVLHPGVVAKPVAPAATDAKPDAKTPEKTADKPSEKPSEKPTEAPTEKPEVKAPPVDSKLLGKELSCIRNGLANAGYAPSEKYIAFIAAGVQASRGPWNAGNDEPARHLLQSAVISSIQAYGFCSESSYPSTDIETDDFPRMRRMINAYGGAASGSGTDYFNQTLMVDPVLRTTSLYHIFGMRGQASPGWLYTGLQKTNAVDAGFAWTFPNEVTWQHKTLTERSRIMSDLKGQPESSKMPFENCQADIKDQASKKGGAYDLEVLSKDSRKRSNGDPSLMKQVSAANLSICKAMANACQLDADETCKVTGYVQDSSGPIKGNGTLELHREPSKPGPKSSAPVVQ